MTVSTGYELLIGYTGPYVPRTYTAAELKRLRDEAQAKAYEDTKAPSHGTHRKTGERAQARIAFATRSS